MSVSLWGRRRSRGKCSRSGCAAGKGTWGGRSRRRRAPSRTWGCWHSGACQWRSLTCRLALRWGWGLSSPPRSARGRCRRSSGRGAGMWSGSGSAWTHSSRIRIRRSGRCTGTCSRCRCWRRSASPRTGCGWRGSSAGAALGWVRTGELTCCRCGSGRRWSDRLAARCQWLESEIHNSN